jgi:hypothetical protein
MSHPCKTQTRKGRPPKASSSIKGEPPARPKFRQKLFIWRQGYDWRTEPRPTLKVVGRRLPRDVKLTCKHAILTSVIQKLITPADQRLLKTLQITGFEFGPSVAIRLSRSRVHRAMHFDFTNVLNTCSQTIRPSISLARARGGCSGRWKPAGRHSARGELRSARQRHRRVHMV